MTARRAWYRMPHEELPPRALVVQLARLGDLMQSLPAIAALQAQPQIAAVDVLCAAPLASLASCMRGVDRALSWDVPRWHAWAERWVRDPQTVAVEIEAYLKTVMPMPKPYEIAYNLNQHRRAIVAATLVSERVVGPGERGPLSMELPPWADYLRHVARDRGANRVHLADVFCGLCGIMPPGSVPRLRIPTIDLPADLSSIGKGRGLWVAIAVGAGEGERCVPPVVWRDWIRAFLDANGEGHVILIGSHTDRERAGAIQDGLSSLCLGRIWDCTGRTTLMETAALLARCGWVVGSDTGPLHLGAAVGTRAMGFYFARARVHETGPYGQGHWTWQAQSQEERPTAVDVAKIERWPIVESVRLLVEGNATACDGWRLWQSALDRLGVYQVAKDAGSDSGEPREDVWRRVHRPLQLKARTHEYV